jgi:hypothetical protein
VQKSAQAVENKESKSEKRKARVHHLRGPGQERVRKLPKTDSSFQKGAGATDTAADPRGLDSDKRANGEGKGWLVRLKGDVQG